MVLQPELLLLDLSLPQYLVLLLHALMLLVNVLHHHVELFKLLQIMDEQLAVLLVQSSCKSTQRQR